MIPIAQELANEVVKRLNYAQQPLIQNEPMWVESTNQRPKPNYPKLDTGNIIVLCSEISSTHSDGPK